MRLNPTVTTAVSASIALQDHYPLSNQYYSLSTEHCTWLHAPCIFQNMHLRNSNVEKGSYL